MDLHIIGYPEYDLADFRKRLSMANVTQRSKHEIS